MASSLIDIYQELGWTTFPLISRGKRPLKGSSWESLQTEKPESDLVDSWKRKIVREDLNIGLITGKLSNLFVVDFDYEYGGDITLGKLIDEGIISEDMPSVKTPHGRHFYFKFPEHEELRNTAKRAPGLDTRGEGGYVVSAPSKLDDGEYTWVTEISSFIELPEVPEGLVDLLKKSQQVPTVGGVPEYSSLLEGVGQGQRNNTAAMLAGHFLNKGISSPEVLAIISSWNDKNDPPLGRTELETVVSNIRAKEITKRIDSKPSQIEYKIPEDIPIISEYVRLTSAAIPAPKAYHVLCCLSLLSTLLAENVCLHLKSGPIFPNLYTMLLADTTWTYKTTSMAKMLGILDKVYPDALIGSGGSPEGLFYALSERSGRSSLFWKDEAVGFFYEAGQKNYMAGMLESLTKFYDCQSEARVLAGDQRQNQTVRTIYIRDPRLSLMVGGTLTRFFDVIDEDRIMDGFLPRFLFSVKEGSAANMRSLEIATPTYNRDADLLLQNIMGMYLCRERELTTEQAVLDAHKDYMMEVVTSEYATFAGRDFGGVYNRLAISVLKVAMILACLDGKKKVKLKMKHLENAILLSHDWKQSVDYIVKTVGKPAKERLYDKVLEFILDNGGTTTQATLMKVFHLENRDIKRVIETLLQREMIYTNGRLVSLR